MSGENLLTKEMLDRFLWVTVPSSVGHAWQH